MSLMTIGEVAESVGVSPSTIRYYERIALLPQPQRVNGRREYDDAVLPTLRLILMAQSIGFALTEIRDLLYRFPPDTPPAVRWQAFAQHKIAEADAVIREANERKLRFEQTLLCDCATLEACSNHLM